MKMDKQALAKHHFWILLGVFALFAVLLVILVPVLIGSEIEEKRSAIDKIEQSLKTSSSGPTTQGLINEEVVQLDTLSKRRETIWREMYARQQGVLGFPADLATRLDKTTFGGDIDDRSRAAYREDTVYRASYEEMASLIKPTEYAGGWQAVLQPVVWKTTQLPSSEEIWLSLEDMCVRREVLKILRDANAVSSQFELVKAGADLPKSSLGDKFSRRLVNRLYQIDLVLDEKGRGNYVFSGKIKNISGRRQVIYALQLDVWLFPDPSVNEPARPVMVEFPLAALAADETAEFRETKVTLNQRPVDLFQVRMRHNFKTVPIKQLVQLSLGLNAGHRMADRKPQPPKFSVKEPEAGAAATSPMGPGGLSMGPMGGGIGKMMEAMGGGGASGSQDMTPNGIARSRYIDVTDQVRRMPVAVVLIVDQRCIQDVLTAFTNSKQLRYQITQFHWTRSHGAIVPSAGGSDAGESAAPMGPAGARPLPGKAGGFGPIGPGGMDPRAGGGMDPRARSGFGPGAAGPMGPVGPMAPGGFGPGGFGPGAEAQSSAEPPMASLVELTVYGVANLYEKPKDAETTTPPTTPSTTTTPAAPPTTTTQPAAPAAPKAPAEPAKPTPGTPPKAKAPG